MVILDPRIREGLLKSRNLLKMILLTRKEVTNERPDVDWCITAVKRILRVLRIS
jgi:hypothetical protein